MLDLSERFDFEGRAVAWGEVGAGPPLVLVHGTPFSAQVWRRLAPLLARRRRVLWFDLVGYGRSDMTPGRDVSLAVQGRLLAALVRHWGVDAPHLVAHDFGGATALRGWILHGLRYRALTLVDPVALSPWGSPFVAHVRRHEAAFAGLPDPFHHALLARYVRGAVHREISDGDLDAYLSPWTGDVGKAAFYAQIAQMDLRHTAEIEPRLAEVDCPTTIVWGEEDAWLPRDQGRRLAQILPNARLVAAPGAGHLVQEDAPEVILAAILDSDPAPAPYG